MILYSSLDDPMDHAVRFVMKEKNVEATISYVTGDNLPEDLASLNPRGTILTLVDRQLSLYYPQVIVEYLDERYPYPPLMPVEPVARALNRQMRSRMKHDLYDVVGRLKDKNEIAAAAARKLFQDNLSVIASMLAQKPFFYSDELTLMDCVLAPMIWRLPSYGVKLPPTSQRNLTRYGRRIFERKSFRASLSEEEQELREIA